MSRFIKVTSTKTDDVAHIWATQIGIVHAQEGGTFIGLPSGKDGVVVRESVDEVMALLDPAPTAQPEAPAGSLTPRDRDFLAEVLREYATAMTSGELSGAGRYTPATLVEAAQELERGAQPEAPAGLPDGIHHYQSPEPGDPYHGYDGSPTAGWWIDVYEDGSVAVTGRAPASAFAPCVADAQRRGWGGQ